MTDETTLYVQTTGCTSYVADGERGTTTAVDHYGAFVSLAERDAIFYIELGDRADMDGKPLTHRRVLSAKEIDRDEFDQIVGIAKMRVQMGWVNAYLEATAATPLTPQQRRALRDLLGTVASDIRRGVASPDVRAAYTTWMEAKR